jgi:putative DNA primase/helicase
MKRIILTRGVKLWAVDNIASLASGIDENAKKEWDPINSWLLDLRFAGITTLLLHHTNKEGGQRGTSAREDNIDTSLILKQPADYEADRVQTSFLPSAKAGFPSRISLTWVTFILP